MTVRQSRRGVRRRNDRQTGCVSASATALSMMRDDRVVKWLRASVARKMESWMLVTQSWIHDSQIERQ